MKRIMLFSLSSITAFAATLSLNKAILRRKEAKEQKILEETAMQVALIHEWAEELNAKLKKQVETAKFWDIVTREV